jgi:hypothetical protein
MSRKKEFGFGALGAGVLALAAILFSNLSTTRDLLSEFQASGGGPKMVADLILNPAFQVLLVLVACGLAFKAVRESAPARHVIESLSFDRPKRFLQADSPGYVAHAELFSHTAPVAPPGRFIIDATDHPNWTIGDVLDPIAGSFSPPLPSIQLQYFGDNRTPVVRHRQNVHSWYSLTVRPVADIGPVFTILTLNFQKDMHFHQVKIEFSTPSLLPVNEVKFRNERLMIIVFMGAIPSGVLEVFTVR